MPEVALQKIDLGGAEGFTKAVYAAFRSYLPDAGARILTAHCALSTGWGKAVHNYNLSGMKAGTTWRATKPYAIARGCECVAGLPDNNDPNCVCGAGKGQKYVSTTYWRAYSSLSDAAADMVSVLRASRYASSWNMLLQGNTDYFAQVGRDGWYNADPAQTKTAMMKYYNQVNKYLGKASNTNFVAVATLSLVGYFVWKQFA